MEHVNVKRTMLFVISACLIGMVMGSAVTLAVLNVTRAIPSSGLVVARAACRNRRLQYKRWEGKCRLKHHQKPCDTGKKP